MKIVQSCIKVQHLSICTICYIPPLSFAEFVFLYRIQNTVCCWLLLICMHICADSMNTCFLFLLKHIVFLVSFFIIFVQLSCMSISIFLLIVLCVSTLKAMKNRVKTVVFVHIPDEYDSDLVNITYGSVPSSSSLGPGSQLPGRPQCKPPVPCRGNVEGHLPCTHHIYSSAGTVVGQ